MTKQQVKAENIADDLREKIKRGDLKPGQKLATVRDLAKEWGVAYNTVSKAISLLKAEGVLTGVGGGPTRVRVQPIRIVRDNRDYAMEKDLVLADEDVRARRGVSERLTGIPVAELHADDSTYDVIQASECPPLVVEILQLTDNEKVLRRRYVRQHVEGAGVSKSTSYLPYSVVSTNPRLLDKNEEPWPGGTFHQLWTVGKEVGRMEDRLSARTPTPAEQEELDIPPMVPIVDLIKITYDIQDQPLEVALIPVPGDRGSFIYSTPLERW